MVEVILPDAAKKALMGAPISAELHPRVAAIVKRLFIERTQRVIVQYDGPQKFEGYWKKTTRQASMEQVSIGALKLHGRAWRDYPGD